MNRIQTLFRRKQRNLLNIYFTAGYPQFQDTVPYLYALQQAGADLVEIGIPYSDPYADGDTIQASHRQALHNGMTMEHLFGQLATCRPDIHIPIVLMSYLNPILQYGVEAFCRRCREVGVDGVILADLPFTVYEEEFKAIFDVYAIAYIPLITPLTPDALIHRIDKATNGFIYMVSSVGTTGATTGITGTMHSYFERIEAMRLRSPRLIGFGINDHDSFTTACQHANGAVIGSAFIREIASRTDKPQAIAHRFINRIRQSPAVIQKTPEWTLDEVLY